jgi:hypothetical protein
MANMGLRQIWHTLQTVEPLREDLARERKDLVRELRALRRAVSQVQSELADALQNQEKTRDALPEMQARLDRCMTAYSEDARWAERLAEFRGVVNQAAVKEHAREAVASARLSHDPYPHVVVERLFPEDVYDRFLEAIPPPVFFEKVVEHRDEMAVPFAFAPAYSRAAWSLFHDVIEQAVLPGILTTFAPALDEFVRRSWPSLGSWEESDVALRLSNPRLMLRRPGYRIKPHRDPRWAFLVALIYLSPRDAAQTYGTQLYTLKTERDEDHSSPLWLGSDECELARDVPGIGNSALIFLNSTGAHGAYVPESAPPQFLRHVYQARFSPDSPTKARLIALLADENRDRWVAHR